jgi:sirohydrochlorin cobaltochelatase
MRILSLLIAIMCSNLVFGVLAQEDNFLPSDIRQSMQPTDKLAVLMVHFGTTHDDTRAQTIDAVNAKIKSAYPDAEIREAYTSRIIIRRLKTKGIVKLTPMEALQQLHADGYTHILIQSSNIIDGVEMESLRREVADIGAQFKEIRLGTPLLYHPSDYEKTIEALAKHLPQKTDAVVLVGHGTYTPVTASYAMMDYMLKAKGYSHFHVGTIEGYPSFDDMLAELKKSSARSVLLVPFMFVAGEHAKNDIAGEWKDNLEKAGYTVTVFEEGLGQNPDIQELFAEHLSFIATHKHQDIMDKKKEYAAGKEK